MQQGARGVGQRGGWPDRRTVRQRFRSREMTSSMVDQRRLAIEIIATLVNIKRTAADQLLRRAEVPEELIRRFLNDRDPATGTKLSKRVAAAMVFDELANTGSDEPVIEALIVLAATWDAFHLAADEYQARATVQKAREVQPGLVEYRAQQDASRHACERDAAASAARAQKALLEQQSGLLLGQFDHAMAGDDAHGRGYLLQDLLNRLFDLHNFPVHKAFVRNDGAEQIDGAFEMDGWHYLVECRWRKTPADTRDLDGLIGQVARSGRQCMGVFLAINGWSPHVVPMLQQNRDKCIVLMDGYDLRAALSRQIDLRALVQAKVRALNLKAEPFLSARNCA